MASCKKERSIFWKNLPLQTVFFIDETNKNKIQIKANRYKFEKPTEDSTINAQCRYKQASQYEAISDISLIMLLCTFTFKLFFQCFCFYLPYLNFETGKM